MRENSSMLQSALPIARKEEALAKQRCRSYTQAHADMLSTVTMRCALLCLSQGWDVIFMLWSVNLDSYPWSQCKFRSLCGTGLIHFTTDTLGLQAQAFNHHPQWPHVCWNLIIILCTKWPTSWKPLPRHSQTTRLLWCCHDEVFTSMDSEKNPVQVLPTGESLIWRKNTQREDAITYTWQIWSWHGIWT